ncbi:MAG: right-handed parallel beta-helix repeat-containing protein, partial [Thermoplasmatota archaeon]
MRSRRYWTFIISAMITTSGLLFIPDMMTSDARAAKIIYVGPGGNYSRIQDAIDNASAGDTIRVFNGTYREGLTIEKSLRLIGNCSRSTIINPLDEVGIYVKASDNLIENFRVTHGVDWVSGITVLGAGSNVTVRNCDLSDNGYGIAVQGSTTSSTPENFLIENCTINNTSTAVKVTYMEGCVIRNVTVANFTSSAIGSADSSNCTFSDFRIDSGHWAIVQASSSNMVYENISLSNCVRGFTIRMSWNTTIRSCNVSTCEEYGVYHLKSDDCGYFNNTISDFSYAEYGENWIYPAFYIHSSKNLRIQNNSFLGCNIQLEGDAPQWYTHKVENNTVNHKPLRYLVNRTDYVVSQPSGQITIVNSNNVTVKDQVLNQTEIALITAYSTKINITNCTFKSAEYGVLINPRVQAHVYDLNITENEFVDCSNSAFGITGGRIGRSRIINNTFERSGIGINFYGNDVRYLSDNLIRSNCMRDMVSGIRIDDCSLVDILDNRIINSSSGGIAVSGGYSNAASRIKISGNFIENSNGGMSIVRVNKTLISNNSIENCTSGIHTNSKEFTTVVMNNSVIAPSLVGLSVSGEGTHMHDNSIFMVNSSSSAYGIGIDSSRNDVIENNTIRGRGHIGINWVSSRYTTFINNDLNGSGLVLKYQYWQELTTSDFRGNNTVDDRPVYFANHRSLFTIPGNVSLVILTNCNDEMIDKLTL